MKILFLSGENNVGINFVIKKIKSAPTVEVKSISIGKKRLNFRGKVAQLVKNMIIFSYSKKLSSQDFFLNFFSNSNLNVDDVNSDKVENFIESYNPDVLVISGTKKVNAEILQKVKIKINLHHGIVPFYRGVSSSNWVIKEKDFGNFGITIHEPTEKLDTGKVLLCEKILPFKGEPLRLFTSRLHLEGFFYLLEGIRSIVLGCEKWCDQDNTYSRNLKHSDKPEGFGKISDKDKKLFDAYSNINGIRNKFFIAHNKSIYRSRSTLPNGWYVLNYHSFNSDSEIQKYKSLGYPSIFTTLDNFKIHLDFLEENGAFLSVQDGLKLWKTQSVNRVFFSITIDDGLKSSMPAIQEMNNRSIVPTLFLNSSTCLNKFNQLQNHHHLKELETKNNEGFYFSVDELKHFANDRNLNFEIGTHTQNHKNLRKLDKNEVEKEIVFSHRALELAFEKEIPYFSFPFGKLDSRNYLSDVASRDLNTTNFECYGGINRKYTEHFNVLRIGVHNEERDDFSALLSRQWVR